MHDSASALIALRHRVSQAEWQRRTATSGIVPLGHARIDGLLGGGLAQGCLHEIFADREDASSAGGFAAMIASRVRHAGSAAPLVWLRLEEAQATGGRLHMPGLIELGLGGGDLVIGVLPDPLGLLRVAADVARCAEVAMVVIELWGDPRPLDLTVTRRLTMASAASGVTALLLRIGGHPVPSAAATRWTVRAAPALPLAANAPGFATLDVELVRQRGGRAGGRWIMEWDRDQAIFCDQDEATAGQRRGPPLSGPVVSVAAGGTAGA